MLSGGKAGKFGMATKESAGTECGRVVTPELDGSSR
jgi:hypothetical protein